MIKRKGFPEKNELVMCNVKRITPFAAWCDVDEYDVDGMIHISETAGKWIQNINDHVKLNKQYVAKVVRIDNSKRIINISLKRVSKREKIDKINVFRKEQRAEKILEQAGKELKKGLKESYDEIGYILQEKFGELSTAFEELKKNPKEFENIKISKKWINILIPIVKIAFKDKETILKTEINMKSFEGDGVNRLKKILSEIKNQGINIRYLSAPKYIAEFVTKNPKNEEKNIRLKFEKIIKKSKELKVEFDYKISK